MYFDLYYYKAVIRINITNSNAFFVKPLKLNTLIRHYITLIKLSGHIYIKF